METKEKKKTATKTVVKPEVKKDTWEYKDRNYYLKGMKEPLLFKLGSRHTQRHPLLWFDPDKGYNRELRYATNQRSIFVDEQEGPVTLSHILFENGSLTVRKENINDVGDNGNNKNQCNCIKFIHCHKPCAVHNHSNTL